VIWASGKSPDPESYFIECDALYGRAELYGTAEGNYPDNALRFIVFFEGGTRDLLRDENIA